MKIIEIKRGEIQKKAVEYKWHTHDVTVIHKIIKNWLETGLAQSILLFFKEDNNALHAYMPIVPVDNQQRPEVRDFESAKGMAKILGIEPYPLEGSNIIENDSRYIVSIMRNNYWWYGQEVFRMSDQGNIQMFDTDSPPTWEALKFGRDKIKAVKEITGKTPALLVKAVEAMQREYDEYTGFAQCQIESHSFTIRLEGLMNKGRFMAEDLIRFLQRQFELFNIANPGEGKNYTVHLSGFVPGSSCLVGDYDVIPDQAEKADKIKLKEDIEKAEERVAAIVQAAPVLVDKSLSPAERVNTFKKETGLSNEAAYAAMHEISKMRAPRQTVELDSSDPAAKENIRPSIIIDSAAVNQIMETKRVLAEIIEPDNTRELKGKIVELEHYRDDDLKFGIYVEDEARLYNIHYPKSEDKTVRTRKGEFATIRVFREGPNRPWYFSKWL